MRGAGRSPRSWSGVALLAALALPASARALEASLATHLLVQMPSIVLAGALAAPLFAPVLRLRGHGGPGMVLATTVALFWMLPRSMDAAFESIWVDAAKFATLACLVGVPLRYSWCRISSVARGFVWANLVPMLVVLGWLYSSAPTRLCNFYLEGDQEKTGSLLLCLSAVLSLRLVVSAFRSPVRHGVTSESAAHATDSQPAMPSDREVAPAL